ncbi:TetR/AcrR family transcriptional regulator [Corynebacterium pacaense]|uniref:TetR/AcrR family transcriptional regulator n=1 Tax=Corynebacterium pacaense TaxID=1816684 RepID=UPI0009BA0EB5|nr:TetR family transcriptional regulator [Corynebacterium pacaense]
MAPSDLESDTPVSGDGGETHTATPEDVVVTALEFFAHQGFNDAKLEKIARASGMSKRMIHYHFGDKKGLYIATLTYALKQLRPTAESMQLDSAVPVEGVRKIVEAVYNQIISHPDAVRMLLMENLHGFAGVEGSAALNDHSNVLLNLDKLLMLGQDARAFRPGISAEDVLVLISSLGYFRLSNRSTLLNLHGVDLTSDANTAGMKRMVVDTVLAFLTANLPNNGSASYLTQDTDDTESASTDAVYGFDTDLFES